MSIMSREIEEVPIDSLVLFPGNPRIGKVPLIAESLEANQQYRPLVVQKSSRQILTGNHTWQAAKYLRWQTIDVLWLDVDDEAARNIVLSDNSTADQATYDLPALKDLMEKVTSHVGTGYTQEMMDQILQSQRDSVEMVKKLTPQDAMEQAKERLMKPVKTERWDAGPPVTTEEEAKELAERDEQAIIEKFDLDDIDTASPVVKPGLALDPLTQWPRGELPYDWPALDLEKLHPKLETDDVFVYMRPEDLKDYEDHPGRIWLWNYAAGVNRGIPEDRTLVGFFSDDYKFDNFYENPNNWLGRFYNRGFTKVIQPDYSLWIDAPVSVNVWAQYRSLWLSRMMQTIDMLVMPKASGMMTLDETVAYNSHIPENCPVVAIQLQTFSETSALEQNTVKLLAQVLSERVKPQQLLVYTGEPGLRATKMHDWGTDDIIWVPTQQWMYSEVVRKNKKYERVEKGGPVRM